MTQTPNRFEQLLVPDRIILHLLTPRKSAELTVQCAASSPVMRIINTFIRSLRGGDVRRLIESRSSGQEIYLTAQLANLSSYDLWQLRLSIQKVGGIVERLRENFHLRHSNPSNQCPEACLGCRYYYGKKHGQQLLVCAMHPYGPLGNCPDKEL